MRQPVRRPPTPTRLSSRIRRLVPAWLLSLLLLAWGSGPRNADATDGAPAPTAPPAASKDNAAAASPRDKDALTYRVVIDAPKDLVDSLTQSVDLVRWQSYTDMTADLLDRLAREAIEQGKEAAATSGYFSAQVDVAIDRATDPLTVTLRVTPGQPTEIREVRIDVSGPASTDHGAGEAAIAKMNEDWLLPQGSVFHQSTWDRAKVRAVATLAASPYAAAKLTQSEASIDPDARTADLSVEIASGPPFRVGRMEVKGLSRYDTELVRNYSTLKPGDLYSGAALDQFLRRLNGSGYFASAQAVLDNDPANADDAPLNVSVIEAPTKKLEAGVGYSTDTEFRVNASYRDVNVDGHALQFYVDARLESLLQSGTLRLIQPPDDRGWVNAYTLAKYERTNLNDLLTNTVGAGMRRSSIEEYNQWQYGAAFMHDQQRPLGGDESTAHALYLDVERIWRRVDDLVAPTRGWILDLEGGVGVPGASTRGFGRAIARFGAWYPVNRDWSLSGKAETGAVVGASRQEVPSTLLFRTGGDTTVRGYAFDSLGVTDGQATVPGRYYVLGSVEVTRWINATWGIATFVDAGNAFDEWNDAKVDLGYGVGARIRTPIGPFRFDVAYGQESRQVRVHFSVGLSF